jgi:hypothetical protein
MSSRLPMGVATIYKIPEGIVPITRKAKAFLAKLAKDAKETVKHQRQSAVVQKEKKLRFFILGELCELCENKPLLLFCLAVLSEPCVSARNQP